MMCLGLHFLPLAQRSSDRQPNPKLENFTRSLQGRSQVTSHLSKTQDFFSLRGRREENKSFIRDVSIFGKLKQKKLKLAEHG